MSFLTVLEKDLTDVENAVVDGAKACLNYVDNVTTTEILPELEAALLAALKVLEQDAIAAILGNNTPAPPPAA